MKSVFDAALIFRDLSSLRDSDGSPPIPPRKIEIVINSTWLSVPPHQSLARSFMLRSFWAPWLLPLIASHLAQGLFARRDRCTQRSLSCLRRSKCYPLGAITAIVDKVETLDTLLIRKSRTHTCTIPAQREQNRCTEKYLPTFAIAIFVHERDKCYFLAVFEFNVLLILDRCNGRGELVFDE